MVKRAKRAKRVKRVKGRGERLRGDVDGSPSANRSVSAVPRAATCTAWAVGCRAVARRMERAETACTLAGVAGRGKEGVQRGDTHRGLAHMLAFCLLDVAERTHLCCCETW